MYKFESIFFGKFKSHFPIWITNVVFGFVSTSVTEFESSSGKVDIRIVTIETSKTINNPIGVFSDRA